MPELPKLIDLKTSDGVDKKVSSPCRVTALVAAMFGTG